jgi:hypothetical protein
MRVTNLSSPSQNIRTRGFYGGIMLSKKYQGFWSSFEFPYPAFQHIQIETSRIAYMTVSIVSISDGWQIKNNLHIYEFYMHI